MKLRQILVLIMATAFGLRAEAAKVKVTMNTVSTTMTLTAKGAEQPIDIGEPDKRIYNFEAPAGEYVLTAFGTDGQTVNGTIVINIAENGEEQEFTVLTQTAYVTNKAADGTAWSVANGDYTIDVKVSSREGVTQTITVGNSVTAGRNTFLALNGNSYYVAFVPSEQHQAEGYTTLYKAGTLTFNVNVNGAIPLAADYSISVPADAELYVGLKFTHFTDFTTVEPKSVETVDGNKVYTYYLADGQTYNFRTWKTDGLTQGGYFRMSIDETKRPKLDFTEADYNAFGPKEIKHDVHSNDGFETGDIFVNINERGHLRMNVGESFSAHAMRTWQLTENSTNNYFIEPDFHYTVIDSDGQPSTGVIEIGNANTTTSPWSDIRAVGEGTVIVLVTYDAIGLNYYNGASKTAYMGGEYWGAIWPENTGVYVVSVGETSTVIKPNMLMNEAYNKETLKLAGFNVDAEHDIFYYLDSEEGAYYTFSPEGVEDVNIAYPVIGEQTVTYKGFGTEGVKQNNDGSYTLLLKEGRQIVRMTDAAGKCVYQVLTAKPCHREISNVTREGSKIFQPGDQIKIQYSGMRHPANKLAGIYNMSAYVTYNGTPNGSSLILSANQYTFGSSDKAQAVTIDIPTSHNVEADPEIVLTDGVIQVNGYGDPIGNHRNISREAGRSPNFTAIAHKTYFGSIPDVRIPLTPVREFVIRLDCNVEDADVDISFNGTSLTPDSNGEYSGTYGTYSITAGKTGYRCYRRDYIIGDDAEGVQTFAVEMIATENAWDGKTVSEPEAIDNIYQLSSGAELAWFAGHINAKAEGQNAVLTRDIDLGDYDWTPIGTSANIPYSGVFNGDGHSISGLYIGNPEASYQGLFGYLKNGEISNVTVDGTVSAKQYVGGIAGMLHDNACIDRCVNLAEISGTSYVGGIAGSLSRESSTISNSYNVGNIVAGSNGGGIVGMSVNTATVENVFSIGNVSGRLAGACVGSAAALTNIYNAFSIFEYDNTNGQTLVTEEQMRSGEIAYRLGEAFGQEIGVDAHPVLGGKTVMYDETENRYYNEPVTGISDILVPTKNCNAVYYNLDGTASRRPHTGINIIRTTDGSIRKVVIR